MIKGLTSFNGEGFVFDGKVLKEKPKKKTRLKVPAVLMVYNVPAYGDGCFLRYYYSLN